MPVLITRDEAGLIPPRPGITLRPARALVGLVVHHAAVRYDLDRDPREIWREIQNYHMHPHGTESAHSDIDYNAGVWWDGRILLGRDAGVRGAHDAAPGYNDHWLGVVLIGDGSDESFVTDEAFRSILWCWQLGAYVAASAGVSTAFGLTTHRETMATACPGDLLQARVESFRAFLAGLKST